MPAITNLELTSSKESSKTPISKSSEPNAALVHSLWREPLADGNLQDYQVVWAVEQEAGQWRISGLAIEISPDQPPQIVDFEDGTQMAKLLSAERANTAEAAPPQGPANTAIAR